MRTKLIHLLLGGDALKVSVLCRSNDGFVELLPLSLTARRRRSGRDAEAGKLVCRSN